MSRQRHILWGAIVGASVAVAFNAALILQFDVTLTMGFAVTTVPVCAVLGAGAGWLWWLVLGR